MYTKRVQLVNYGPIDRLDITFPFNGESPKPVLLVGENGSGKSLLLSHIVNGLISAKSVTYSETPEVESGKVYKLRSNSYITTECEYYFGRVDFEDRLYLVEMRSRELKRRYASKPLEFPNSDAQAAWDKMNSKKLDYFDSSFSLKNQTKITNIFSRNCILYFPPNRFEEPAWLNEENLRAQAQYRDMQLLEGYTSRRVINYSPLLDNQNWLFELIYDRAVFELQGSIRNLHLKNVNSPVPIQIFQGYSGAATNTYQIALKIVQTITRSPNIRFGIGRRHNRVVAIISESDSETKALVPNIFQLSSGEVSLLNLFLSILRDFDLCGASLSQAKDIRGIVVVDEIDLHLHAVYQYEILPKLIQMFPNIQFIVTTHSPLFVLGMQRAFGEDGFALYRLPQAIQISPEEFGEFGDAYRAFTATSTFSSDIKTAIEGAQKSVVFVEGAIDQKYLRRASELLGKESLFQRIEIRDGQGSGNLAKMWKHSVLPLTETLPQVVVLLFDCDIRRTNDNRGNLYQRIIPIQDQNPIKNGIENMFERETLENAIQKKPAFIDIDPERTRTVRGEPQNVPEQWTVNKDEKANLCSWICETGTDKDFQRFEVIFDLIEDVLGSVPLSLAVAESETVP